MLTRIVGRRVGRAAATGFARLGASVCALARNDERAKEAVELIRARAATGQAVDVRPVACDVSGLAALRAFTDQFSQQEQRLDVLVNNVHAMHPGWADARSPEQGADTVVWLGGAAEAVKATGLLLAAGMPTA
jgi:NAD(P)-dependent dehydrogenase (short-subunit alcohol dehydrogenase family)